MLALLESQALAKSSVKLPPKATSAFDFDFVEELEAPSAGPSGRGLEKRRSGHEVVLKISKKVKLKGESRRRHSTSTT